MSKTEHTPTSAKPLSERLRETYAAWNNPPGDGLPDGAGILLEAADEIDDLQHIFDMGWDADMRAIKRWQSATGRTRVWPDRTGMVVFLMGQLDAAEEALKPFAAFAEKARRFVQGRAVFGGSTIMPTRQFRVADFERAEAAVAAISRATGQAGEG